MRASLLLPLLLTTACTPGGSAPTHTGSSSTPGVDRPAPALTPSQAALAQRLNRLTTEVYGQLRGQPGNLVVSPASLALALTMTWSGARGDTAREMAAVLHIDGSPPEALAAAGAQLNAWNDPGRTKYTLAVANRLFGEATTAFDPAFVADTERFFKAPLEGVDFVNQADAGRQRINAWVAEQTRDRIRELLPAGSVDGQTRLALVNAIYLLADWENPFNPAWTKPAPFYTPGGARDVPTMAQVEAFRYGRADGVSVLEMPYVGGDLSMVVVLPDARDGLGAVEERLSAETLARWIDAARLQQVRVWLPRFEIDPPQPLALAPVLAALGMPTAFDRRRADFTGIADPPNPDDRLFISQVFHKAYVKVNEQGTEAAAATAVVMARAGSAPSAPPPEFRADHPFLFFIRDNRTGVILFAGRVVDPA